MNSVMALGCKSVGNDLDYISGSKRNEKSWLEQIKAGASSLEIWQAKEYF